jgi:alkaline phosphatase
MHIPNPAPFSFASKWLAALVATVMALAGCSSTGSSTASIQAPKNIIIMFADGAASTQWDFGRYSSKVLRRQPFAVTDIVFREGVLGLLSTEPSNAYVVDSAASASAMSTGYKVNNFAVAVTPDGKSVPTLMEIAKAKGKRIGLVTTATVYDATPAAFSIHAKTRDDSQILVDQYLALEPDVLMGGGADYFLPHGTTGGKRKDGKDIVAAFRAKGYQVARNSAELKAVTGEKVLGLFAEEDMDFELDRDPAKEPTTADMTAAALRTLSQRNPNGFVLLVENENVDEAGHNNDAASVMRALWAFDDAVRMALEFQRRNPDTLVIVTGDHETGGFSPTYAAKDFSSTSRKNRFYAGDDHLRMLEPISMSLNKVRSILGRKPSGATLDQLLAKHFPGFTLDADLRELLLNYRMMDLSYSRTIPSIMGRMVARRTGFYFATSGHTTEPSVVGAIGPGAELFRGFQDNTDFGKHLHRLIQGR